MLNDVRAEQMLRGREFDGILRPSPRNSELWNVIIYIYINMAMRVLLQLTCYDLHGSSEPSA